MLLLRVLWAALIAGSAFLLGIGVGGRMASKQFAAQIVDPKWWRSFLAMCNRTHRGQLRDIIIRALSER